MENQTLGSQCKTLPHAVLGSGKATHALPQHQTRRAEGSEPNVLQEEGLLKNLRCYTNARSIWKHLLWLQASGNTPVCGHGLRGVWLAAVGD